MGPPFLLLIYRAATWIAELFAPAILKARARRGKEDPQRLGERLGRASAPRPEGTVVWLHGISVGESLSLLPLIQTLRREHPDIGLLVTSGTQTSAALLAERLPAGVVHQYAPIDGPRAARRFLDHWRPALAVFVESELWPNLLTSARRRGIRTALLSAKLSDSSARGWAFAPAMARTLLGGFDLLLAQDERAAERFVGFDVRANGLADLKFGAEPLPVDESALDALRAALKGRPVIVAASTHPGEDEIVLEAFRQALESPAAADRKPLLVIVPRHPERGAVVEKLAGPEGFVAARRTLAASPAECDVYVVDALGELGLWYRLAGLAVVGGSLVEGLAGHNPLEPARLGCPVVSGPHIANWTTAFDELEEAEAARLVAPGALSGFFRAAIEGDAGLAAMAARARAHVEQKDVEARAAPALVLDLLP